MMASQNEFGIVPSSAVFWKRFRRIGIAAAAKSLQLCPTLCDPIDGSLPGSHILGILQARTLEWVAISFSNAWKWKVKVKLLGRVWLFAVPWTAAYQAPPSMGFSRQEYWSGLPLNLRLWLTKLPYQEFTLLIKSLQKVPKYEDFKYDTGSDFSCNEFGSCHSIKGSKKWTLKIQKFFLEP